MIITCCSIDEHDKGVTFKYEKKSNIKEKLYEKELSTLVVLHHSLTTMQEI